MDVTKTGNGKRVTSTGDWKMKKKKKREENRELEIKLQKGLGFKLGFVPIFHFPVPDPRFSKY